MEVQSKGPFIMVWLKPADVDGDLATRASGDRLIQLARASCRTMLLDMAAVDYLNSSALAMLIMLHRVLLGVDGTLTLRHLTPRVRELFQITRLSEIFDIRDTDAPPERVPE